MSDQNSPENEVEVVDVNELIAQRREKLNAMREAGQAFPNDFRRTDVSDDLHIAYGGKEKEELEELNVEVAVAGRMMTRRIMGKASFATIQDMGTRIQVYVARDLLPEGFYNTEFKKWDLGDIIAAKGTLFKTKSGELSIRCSEVRLMTKALRPLPDKFHGLSDQETCYRQRYLDLIANEKSREVFKTRSKIVAFIRNYLTQKNFMEVETPMMQVIPGGATARPFKTHHNALDMDMYLRIAPELNLKRLVVGGFENVFEINRSFRNEGLSTRHNPEFTMLEFYWGYADYNMLMDLTEDMLRELAISVKGTSAVHYQGNDFDFGKKFDRLTVVEAILKYTPGTTVEQVNDLEQATAIAKGLGIEVKDSWGLGKIQIEIFEETGEHQLMQPTFITEYPAEVSPLARRNDDNPFITDRFEFFVGGREIANGFSELNDAEDQDQRFLEQVAQKDAGDDEAMFYDADYITALEYGLPPTAGEGIGIDRLVMLFTDAPSIRDVLLFPHMRPSA
ncbi:lysine--tRNA ligase [Psychrobium sp. 1_MG-2023]|uniref:lysine--tRNA ligase n=1 Tax=Psychrobium sp. 1_MG-2023 TaxID=3062624 RepID=UPI000C32F6F4|nr:lysine--tRNA ligase [Psychrobium sp. 1_MG-2023]MDP2560639.1 lysine--tRNA ligase [Psychrobium sp. 1_MG-2023]PKF56537.1 lysine--tRNA ligase [Alteromonadales bacterium alter-6D02]